MNLIYTFLRWASSLWCKHDLQFGFNLYGDAIIQHGYNRSVWSCRKCGSTEYKPDLFHDEGDTE